MHYLMTIIVAACVVVLCAAAPHVVPDRAAQSHPAEHEGSAAHSSLQVGLARGPSTQGLGFRIVVVVARIVTRACSAMVRRCADADGTSKACMSIQEVIWSDALSTAHPG